MNMTVTNVDLGSVILYEADFEDGPLTFTGAATVLEGTILARDSVSGAFVPFVVGGSTNENGIPKAILTYEVTAEAAGDIPIRAGITGKYREERLVIDADGDGSNITPAIRDQLRDYDLVPISVTELNLLDNQ